MERDVRRRSNAPGPFQGRIVNNGTDLKACSFVTRREGTTYSKSDVSHPGEVRTSHAEAENPTRLYRAVIGQPGPVRFGLKGQVKPAHRVVEPRCLDLETRGSGAPLT